MTSRWRHCHGNFTAYHLIVHFHCEQVAIRWIILFSACYLFLSNVRFHMFFRKKRNFRRFFDRLYDTLDMSVWIEKLTLIIDPYKNQPNKFQRIVWCRIIHRTIYILKMRHQNRDEFHQFQEYSSQIQSLVIVVHMADSGISLLRSHYVSISLLKGSIRSGFWLSDLWFLG